MEHNLTKQRIVGGIILVSIAVIVLPMIFSESGEREISSSNIPQKPGYLAKTEIIPLEIKHLPTPEGASQPQVIESTAEALPESSNVEAVEPREEFRSDLEAIIAPAVATTENTDMPVVEKEMLQVEPVTKVAVSGWVVQVGSFSSELNAFGLRDRLRAKGYSAFVERVEGSKVVYRVRVGPEIKQQQAQKVKGELMEKMKLDGLVMRHH